MALIGLFSDLQQVIITHIMCFYKQNLFSSLNHNTNIILSNYISFTPKHHRTTDADWYDSAALSSPLGWANANQGFSGNSQGWRRYTRELPSIVSGKASVQFRWAFGTICVCVLASLSIVFEFVLLLLKTDVIVCVCRCHELEHGARRHCVWFVHHCRSTAARLSYAGVPWQRSKRFARHALAVTMESSMFLHCYCCFLFFVFWIFFFN